MAKVKVWDVFVRFAHWALGLLVLGSFLTSEVDRLTPVHVRLGLAVLAIVGARIAWGFVGTAPARFRAFVRGPRDVLAYARELARGRSPVMLSHNPLGGAMVVALLAVLLGVAATGLGIYLGPKFDGPLTGVLGRHGAHALKEVHEGLATVLLVLIATHVAGVLFSSWRERQNLVKGMITGWKRAPEAAPSAPAPQPLASPWARLAASVVLGAVSAVVLALLFGVPLRSGAAASIPGELHEEHRARVRQVRPGFTRHSEEEGRAPRRHRRHPEEARWDFDEHGVRIPLRR